MITYDDAKKIAKKFNQYPWPIAKAMDAGSCWIFEATPSKTMIGIQPLIKVTKKDGIASTLFLPDEENFKLLEDSVPISL